MDPAALGTLAIGLGAERDEPSHARHRSTRSRSTQTRGSLRVAVALTLRSLADRLDRPAPQPIAG